MLFRKDRREEMCSSYRGRFFNNSYDIYELYLADELICKGLSTVGFQ